MCSKKTLTLVLCALSSIVACFGAASSEAPNPLSLSEIKKHAEYPKENKDRRDFLFKLKDSLGTQRELVHYSKELKEGYYDVLKARSKKRAQMVKDNPSTLWNMFISPRTPEAVAFNLKHRPIITLNTAFYRSPTEYARLEETLLTLYEPKNNPFSQWESTKNKEVQAMIEIIKEKCATIAFERHGADHILMPYNLAINAMKDLQNTSSSLSWVIKHERSPLLYAKKIYFAQEMWRRITEKKIQNRTFLDQEEQEDISCEYQKSLARTQYEKKEGELNRLEADIETEIKRLQEECNNSFLEGLLVPKSTPQRRTSKKAKNKKKLPQRPNRRNTRAQRAKSEIKKNNSDKTPAQPSKNQSAAASSSSASSSTAILKTQQMRSSTITSGSYTMEENDIMVTIKDPSNEVTIKLFKVDNPQSDYTHKNIRYTITAQRWLDDPDSAMKEQGYNTPGNPKFKYRNTAKRVHSFTPLADRYLPQCATKGTIDSKKNPGQKDSTLTMPGLMIDKDGNEKFGLFVYIINSKTKVCYHRNFVERTSQRLIGDYYQNGFYAVEFPELH